MFFSRNTSTFSFKANRDECIVFTGCCSLLFSNKTWLHFVHHGLNRKLPSSGGLFERIFAKLFFFVRSRTGRESLKMLVRNTESSFQSHKFPKLPACLFASKYHSAALCFEKIIQWKILRFCCSD